MFSNFVSNFAANGVVIAQFVGSFSNWLFRFANGV